MVLKWNSGVGRELVGEWAGAADLVFAEKLGSKVELLVIKRALILLTWLAIRNPVKVAGLILFSPAFCVHSFAQTGAWDKLFDEN